MPEAIVILLGTVFVNNFVLVQFLGLCPFMGASNRIENALGMSAATTFVLTLGCAAGYLINVLVLVPLGLTYLRIIVFIVMIASLVQFSSMVMRATQPRLHQGLGIYVPLITTNCAVLGVALQSTGTEQGFAASVLYGFGAAAGFSMLLIIFAAIREKMAHSDTPLPFQGAAINMITAGVLSIGFMGFTGMD